MCETNARPEVDMSVAGLSPVCPVAQSELTSQVSVPEDTCTGQYACTQPSQDEVDNGRHCTERSATTSEASQPDKSVKEKVFIGYKTKFKSTFSIEGISKGKFTLKKAKGGPGVTSNYQGSIGFVEFIVFILII